MKKFKKILKYSFFLFVLYLILTVFPMVSFNKKINKNALQSNYKKGVYHIHSNFSDGHGDLEDISTAAKEAGSDFAILTDHGNPNLSSTAATAWMNGVLLIGGSELSLNEGHLAVFGYKPFAFKFPPEAEEALKDLNLTGGVSFISHPFDKKIPWRNWGARDFTGIEIMSSYTSAKNAGILDIFTFPVQYVFNKDYALLNLLYYPRQNMTRWDQLNSRNNHPGIYALDAHASLKISRTLKLNLPSYQAMFRILKVYVKIDRRLQRDPHSSSDIIIKAIRAGRFFNCIEALAPANGFDTFFITEENKQILEMGSVSSSYRGDLVLEVPFSFGTTIRVLKDGGLYKEIAGNFKKRIQVPIRESGVYRSEIYLHDTKFDHLPWIVTNPFFLGRVKLPQVSKSGAHSNLTPLFTTRKDYFKIEKNRISKGEVSYQEQDNDAVIRFTYHLLKGQRKDFWVALAHRQAVNFSGFTGISLTVKSERPMRYWFELRTRTGANRSLYRHSFYANTQWNTVKIPFTKFYRFAGTDFKLDLTSVYALFISINNAITYPGTEGALTLKNIGLYR